MYTASFLFINIITNISSTCKKKKARGGHTAYDIIFHSEYTAGTLLESKQFGHGGAMSPFVTSCHIMTHSFTGHEIKDFPAATANMLKPANVPTGFKPTLYTLSCRRECLFYWTEPGVFPVLVPSWLDLLFPATACMEPLQSEKNYFSDLKTNS